MNIDINILVLEATEKTYRKRAEIFIIKDKKIMLGQPYNWDGFIVPGGGVDDNETIESAAKREVLEEIGVQVKNLRLLSKVPKYINYNMHETHRYARLWKGTETYSFIARFSKYNMKKWGKEEDSFKVVEVDIDDALKFFKNHARLNKSKDPYNYQKAMCNVDILNQIKGGL